MEQHEFYKIWIMCSLALVWNGSPDDQHDPWLSYFKKTPQYIYSLMPNQGLTNQRAMKYWKIDIFLQYSCIVYLSINSLAPGRCGCWINHFQTHIMGRYLKLFQWNYPKLNVKDLTEYMSTFILIMACCLKASGRSCHDPIQCWPVTMMLKYVCY